MSVLLCIIFDVAHVQSSNPGFRTLFFYGVLIPSRNLPCCRMSFFFFGANSAKRKRAARAKRSTSTHRGEDDHRGPPEHRGGDLPVDRPRHQCAPRHGSLACLGHPGRAARPNGAKRHGEASGTEVGADFARSSNWCPFSPNFFWGEGKPPTKIDYRKKSGTNLFQPLY